MNLTYRLGWRRRLGFRALLTALALGLAELALAANSGVPALDAPSRPPYVPASDDEILQQVPARSDPAVRRMAVLRAQLKTNPRNFRVANQLAWAYLSFGRRRGDANYAGYAEAVIAPWMASVPPPADALVAQATILQVRHEFAAARKLLQQALERDPQNAQARLTTATLDMVQGNYAAARAGCAETTRAAGFTLGAACNANLRLYVGEARQSIALLKEIESSSAQQSPELKAWVQGMLAEAYERLGDPIAAESHYRKALSHTPDDNFLAVAYADYLLDHGRPAEVVPLLAEHSQSDVAYLRLALAHAALKSPDASRHAWIMAARFEALTQRGSDFFGREQARFALDLQHDPRTALELARKNWEIQREPWDARVLLEAALAADKPQEAAAVLAFLQQSRLEDPNIEPLARKLQMRINTLAARR